MPFRKTILAGVLVKKRQHPFFSTDLYDIIDNVSVYIGKKKGIMRMLKIFYLVYMKNDKIIKGIC